MPIFAARLHRQTRAAFTLVELAIVLVIVGLLVGGVLVGRDLIDGAAIHSQIAQLQKYSAATNAFRDKYFAIPGDMKQTSVTQWGFTAAPTRQGFDSNGSIGRGDGDGILQGSVYGGSSSGTFWFGGETLWFWEDLSANSGLIEGAFKTAVDAAVNAAGSKDILQYVPQAKLADNQFLLVGNFNGANYFYLTAIGNYNCAAAPCINSGTVNTSGTGGPNALQAEQMDTKLDDGAPASGAVQFGFIINNAGMQTGTSAYHANTCYDTVKNQYFGGNEAAYCPILIKFQ